MKKGLSLIAVVTVFLLAVTPVMAHEKIHNVSGIKLDAPNLVQFTDNLSLGAELSKDVMSNLFYPDSFDYIEADEGYTGYVKLTFTGSIFDLRK